MNKGNRQIDLLAGSVFGMMIAGVMALGISTACTPSERAAAKQAVILTCEDIAPILEKKLSQDAGADR